MFVPSLFSGFLIDRFGPMTMNIVGSSSIRADRELCEELTDQMHTSMTCRWGWLFCALRLGFCLLARSCGSFTWENASSESVSTLEQAPVCCWFTVYLPLAPQITGWNFSYIAASTIILKMAKPGRELQTIQGINDTAIQALMAIIFLISAPLYRAVNWNVIAAISMALMGLAALTMLAIFRLPMKGMRDDFVGRKGYVRQPKDAEIGETGVKEEVEMENK